jgi:hypothetical protein
MDAGLDAQQPLCNVECVSTGQKWSQLSLYEAEQLTKVPTAIIRIHVNGSIKAGGTTYGFKFAKCND